MHSEHPRNPEQAVALGLADCLHAMGRDDQARSAYKLAAERHPELKPVLDALAGQITPQDMRRLNYAVEGQHRDVRQVVHEFLLEKRLIGPAARGAKPQVQRLAGRRAGLLSSQRLHRGRPLPKGGKPGNPSSSHGSNQPCCPITTSGASASLHTARARTRPLGVTISTQSPSATPRDAAAPGCRSAPARSR